MTTRWYVHRSEYETYMRSKYEEMGAKLHGEHYGEMEVWDYRPDVPDPEVVLRQVVQMFPDFLTM